ncbi:hypothetical protein G7067_04390 [Leucobacter insecticola]|uniref:Uncharacterized protein n=1 Tax=Leucobacter insecticola TaxID=2714934 RepID=A0A6G8FHQ5_9MICO|nr:hypothetical protein [Leucobacter insecticola]QIM15823.1 hypothetical protein G7067_04390 [Leucobacter insecticola]
MSFPEGKAAPLFEDWADDVDDDVFEAMSKRSEEASNVVSYPVFSWEASRFTPFSPGTSDYKEWSETITPKALTELRHVENPVVLFIGHSNGWPNHPAPPRHPAAA